MWWILVAIAVAIYLFSRGRRKSKVPEPAGSLSGPGSYSIDIVGESHYQDALENICGGRSTDGVRKDVTAVLVLEDSNPHDSHAVRVDINGATVGYLPRAMALQYRSRLKEAGHPRLVGKCNARIVGGWDRGGEDRGYFGVKLDLPVQDDS